jgi:8-oxo-dGTP diphosphatase
MFQDSSPLHSDLSDFPRPNLSVDLILMTIEEDALHILMLERGSEPFKGHLTLPGGFVHPEESLDDTAKRVLQGKAHLVNLPVEQLYSFSDPRRDPRGWVVSVVYFALVPFARLEEAAGSDEGLALLRVAYDGEADHKDAGACTLYHGKLKGRIGFDHEQMIRLAVDRLRGKLDLSTLAFGLLPKRFTLYELQCVHEIILGRKLNKALFRKKMLAQKWADGSSLFATGIVTSGRRHRPAELFELRRDAEENAAP